jgi:hypothetical protein
MTASSNRTDGFLPMIGPNLALRAMPERWRLFLEGCDALTERSRAN